MGPYSRGGYMLEMFKKVVSGLARIILQVGGKFWRWSCQHIGRMGRGKSDFSFSILLAGFASSLCPLCCQNFPGLAQMSLLTG